MIRGIGCSTVLNIRMLHWLKLLLLMIVGVRYYSPLLLSLVTVATGNGGDFLSPVGSSTTDDIYREMKFNY